MDDEILLLILRIAAGVCLLAFMGGVVYFLQRDYRAVADKTQTRWQVRGHLVVIANETTSPAPGTTLPLAPATTLGRAPGNTIQIDDRYASNEHARVVQRLGRWWLEDQQSRNGTRLNGVPVEEPVVLSSGDVISIGSVDLRLELD